MKSLDQDLALPENCTVSQLSELLSASVRNQPEGVKVGGAKVVFDSRRVTPGAVFVAYRGVDLDGHRFIPSSIENGAGLVILEDPASAPAELPCLVVEDGRKAFSKLSAFCTSFSIDKLKCFGITGTNGKTTCLWLFSELLRSFGERVLRVGTLGMEFEGEFFTKNYNTTPSPEQIHIVAEEAVTRGATACVMESSSHALKQSRVDDIPYQAGVFLNLTPDHTNYHPDMEDYLLSKRRLFELILEGHKDAPLITGLFDEYGERVAKWAAEHSSRARTFGMEGKGDYQIKELKLSAKGLQFQIQFGDESFSIDSPLIGEFNAHNVTAIFALAHTIGYDGKKIAEAFSQIGAPVGRLERFEHNGASIFVDYAHAPDALRTVLETLKPLTEGDLWVLFGVGGGKDPTRRLLMGNVAKEVADKVIVTSDNPRDEEPQKIIDEILESGVQTELVEIDRRKAIKASIDLVRPGDVLVVAGRGHEDYQVVKGEAFYLFDQDEVRAAIEGAN